VILAHPVLDGEGRLTAVLFAALNLVYASRAVTWAHPGVPLLWAVVDEQGLVLLHSRPETASGIPLGPLPGMFRGETIVPGTRWRCVAVMPADMAAARVRETFFRIGLPAGLIFFISAAVGLWIAYSTWRPIRDLTAAVPRVGAGDPTVQVPVQASGEVGELAATFAETLTAVDRRRGELAALLEAGRAIASSLDLEHSLQAIIQQATIISGTSVVRLLLLDADGKVLRSRVGVGLPMEEERDLVIPVGESFSGQVVATGKPLAVADTRGDPRLRYPQHPTRYGLVSYLGLPVKSGDRILGVMVFNTTSPRTYSDDEIAYLSAFADQAAVTIENARLFQQEQDRRRQIEAVRAVAEEITRELDLRAVLNLIVRRAVDLVGASSGMLRLWDQEAGLLVPQSWVGQDQQSGAISLRLGEAVAGTAAERHQGLVVNDFRHSPYATPLLLECTTHVAVLAEPLLYRDRLIGVINLNRDEPGRPFTEEDRQPLTLFAIQAAIAIENARLFTTADTRASELDTLREIEQAVTARLELPAVLEGVVTGARRLLGAQHAEICLWDEERQNLRFGAAHGAEAERVRTRTYELGRGVIGTVALTRKPLIVDDYQASPYALPDFPDVIATITVPLLFGDRLLGVLHSHTTQRDKRFTTDDLRPLLMLASHAAIAIENARLYEATRRAAQEAQSLYEVGQSLTTSLDPREVLHLITVKTTELLETPHAQVVLWDEETKTLRFGAAYGAEAEKVKQEVFRLGEGVNGTVAETRKPLLVNDYQRFPKRRPHMTNLVAVIGVPLLYRGRLLGVLTSHATQAGTILTEDHLALLTSFANQAAIAIENARLHEEIRRYAGELETRVRQRTAELEEALRVKVEFLGKMSHELRTPLNFILGFSDLLQQGTGGPLSPKQATYLDRIQGGGRRLLSLVSDVLDIAQLDAGKSRLRLEPVILAPLVQEILGLVQIQVSQKQLKVTTALDPWMPFIVADRFKLAQILHNLVGNAVKFTPDGGSITIRTYQEAEGRKQEAESRRQKAEGSGQTSGELPPLPSAECRLPSGVIEVEDTGIGIRSENLETVFEAFYQVDGSETRAQGGTGLGLALVRKLVELHGGWVWAESAGPGQGSRFVVRLPRLEVPKAKRILLVEDEALIRIPMASALESAGFAVEGAATGANALAVMEAEAFDLLILDVVLPDMEGWEILRRVREAEEIRTLPVLVVTGLESLNAEQALALGADEFLTKPVSPRVLVDTVVRLLAWSAASGAGVGLRSIRTVERPGE
jgi:GAF domain-containing protein/ActR/RegA family two-component response regulator